MATKYTEHLKKAKKAGIKPSRNVEEDYSGKKKSTAYHDSKMAFDREKLFTPQKVKFPYKIEEIGYDSATYTSNAFRNKVREANSPGVGRIVKNRKLKAAPTKLEKPKKKK